MRRLLTTVTFLLVLAMIAVGQQVLTAATSSENARIKPLVAARLKATEAYNAKARALPEFKALQEAQEKFEKVAQALPEYNAQLLAQASVLREAHRIMAEHKLSSMEYEPRLNDKGDLEFVLRKSQ